MEERITDEEEMTGQKIPSIPLISSIWRRFLRSCGIETYPYFVREGDEWIVFQLLESRPGCFAVNFRTTDGQFKIAQQSTRSECL